MKRRGLAISFCAQRKDNALKNPAGRTLLRFYQALAVRRTDHTLK